MPHAEACWHFLRCARAALRAVQIKARSHCAITTLGGCVDGVGETTGTGQNFQPNRPISSMEYAQPDIQMIAANVLLKRTVVAGSA